MSKQDRRFAEVAAQWLAVKVYGCTYIRKAIRSQFQSVDFFGSDIMGMREDGTKVFIQATAGQDSAISTRRKKLEKYTWHDTDTISLAALRKEKEGRSYRYYYKIQFYVKGVWTVAENIEVPREWFKKYEGAT